MASCSSCSSCSSHSPSITTNLDTKSPYPYEVNDEGIPIPILQVGSKSNTKSNIIHLSTLNPLFIEVKNIFKSIIIQNGALEKVVLKLFNENVFPRDETFSQVLEKVFEDYLTGFTRGFLYSQYKIHNTSEYPIVTLLSYKPNYLDIYSIGYHDGQQSDGQESETATAASLVYCYECCDLPTTCLRYQSSCSECCDYICGQNLNNCPGSSC